MTAAACLRALAPRRLAVAGLLAIGLWQLGSGLYIPAKAWLAQILIERAWSEARRTGGPVRPWPWADTAPVARLGVPALGIERMVLAGASGRTLAFGAGHAAGTALPGHPGASMIGGHRDTHLRFLEQVAPGTRLTVERPDGVTVAYTVVSTAVADSRDATFSAVADGPPRLALVTCYPFDAVLPGGPLRYVVEAVAVE